MTKEKELDKEVKEEKPTEKAEAEKVEAEKAPVKEEKAEKDPKKGAAHHAPAIHPANWAILAVLLLAIGYTGYATHLALTSPADAVTPLVKATPVPGVPELKLHQNHQRQGPEIQAETDLGRPNPLLKP